MLRTYRLIEARLPGILKNADTENVFEARVFDDLYFVAKANALEGPG